MVTFVAFLVVLSIVAYYSRHGFTAQPLNPRMMGSVPFEDRDIARIEHDLVR